MSHSNRLAYEPILLRGKPKEIKSTIKMRNSLKKRWTTIWIRGKRLRKRGEISFIELKPFRKSSFYKVVI